VNKVSIDLKNNKFQTHNKFITSLVGLNYNRVNMVLEPGEFAVRGSIIDVYPINHSHPIRIEYFDDEIERLNSFNVHSQRSISNITKTEIHYFKSQSKDNFFHLIQAEEKANNLLSDITEEDYIVHELFGIGVYKGLVRLNIRGQEGEYAFIKYKGEDKVYVPVINFKFLHKYDGGGIVPKINGLHDGSWERVKNKVKKAAEELAEDIFLLYKLRFEEQGHAFQEDSLWQIELEESFPHKETKDQMRVCEEIKQDMESAKPMDRLICGDVGYGKTEVLIRAAFKAIENNKQVACVVPTTILAEQHYYTFKQRLKEFPYIVKAISRFNRKEEQQSTLKALKEHKIDIIIGTHRLLQKDVEFADLGLLIIDEEQRFGVGQKEKIKQIKKNIDVISVSATPIPRTLYMALTGGKDLSSIVTPPKDRKPVLTKISQYNEDLVKQAIANEIMRNGQVFYVYNRVDSIEKKYQELKRLLPDIPIAIAHGQMPETKLQKVIHQFWHQEFKVLLCTTIIENGMDMPNVNTIIIDNADKLGLSQIHQLRGRVGRTEKQAYAYLLYSENNLSEKAAKRLRAIKEYAALGAGYQLAVKDLEIRGAGTLLGKKQHGHMTAVGFELYCKLLSDAKSKGKNDKNEKNLSIKKNIFIPDTYIENPKERLSIYKRIMDFKYQEQIEDLKFELIDRYGPIPSIIEILLNNILEY
jgi:transcription-repair coupling factor (superfamily II helicase)